MNEYFTIYNQQYENTGECQYSEYLGCKKCTTCKVEEYENEVKQILKKEHEKEQTFLKKMYGAEDKSHIYKYDKKCVYNTSSKAYKEVLHFHEKNKNWEYYPGIEDIQMGTCYKCNRCGLWG